ncbi:serine integrase family protein [Streptomyces decoyicus]|uniref:hypothetical protein n=1 Tax=Streptomyces decoyicus TaxID=249567 RepID=UPI00364758AB
MTIEVDHRVRTAGYLRCYPEDPEQMSHHHYLLEDLAQQRGLARPTIYFDNGLSSNSCLPRLVQLVAQAVDGYYGAVLVPGLWVFNLDDYEARRISRYLTDRGCRIIMPSERPPLTCTEPPVLGGNGRWAAGPDSTHTRQANGHQNMVR